MKINRTAKIAYHCNTEELALLFLKECDNKHIYWPWPNREKATSKTKWSTNKENTCYVVEGNTLGVAHENYLKQYGIKIIECTKEMFTEAEKSNTKQMVVVRKGLIKEENNNGN